MLRSQIFQLTKNSKINMQIRLKPLKCCVHNYIQQKWFNLISIFFQTDHFNPRSTALTYHQFSYKEPFFSIEQIQSITNTNYTLKRNRTYIRKITPPIAVHIRQSGRIITKNQKKGLSTRKKGQKREIAFSDEL